MSDTSLWMEPFVLRAAGAAVLASFLCGALGTFVVLRRLTFLAGGLSHAAFGGLGLCHFLGAPPQIGAFATAGIAALLLGPLRRREAQAQDARIGVLWAVGMAAGMLFIHLTPGYPPDLSAYLFGNILLVAPGDLALLAVVAFVSLVFLGFYHKELVALAFDAPFAQVQGVRTRRLSTFLLLAVGAAVVALLPVVGLLLVLALLTIPPLISLRWAQTVGGVLWMSIGIGLVIALGGLALSFATDLPTGPTIILTGAALLAVAEAGNRIRRRSD